MQTGICKLCLKEAQLCKSHFMPRALYPRQWQRSQTMINRVVQKGAGLEIKEYLLCRACESRFMQLGENEVLKWLSPKAKKFMLGDRLSVALPRDLRPDSARYAAYDVGVDIKRFAYFAVSMMWRGAVHRWTLPDGTLTVPMDLGPYEDLVRLYLVGEAPFPKGVMDVIILVCSDRHGRSVWSLPAQNQEMGCENYRFIARGVIFRVIAGTAIPFIFRENSCFSPYECIFYGDSSHRIKPEFAPLFEHSNMK